MKVIACAALVAALACGGCRGPAGPAQTARDGGSDVGPDGPPTFIEVTVTAGLGYVQLSPDARVGCADGADPCEGARRLTGGAAAGDFDSDGLVDLYVGRLDEAGILFRNRGDGTFEDVTGTAGLAIARDTNGAVWADVDDDGDVDLYVTTVGGPRFYLFINDGAGRFTEEALARGAALEGADLHVGFSVAVGDYDRDGWLDLHTTEWRFAEAAPGLPSHARLLHNRGATAPGSFEDATRVAGVSIDGLSTTRAGTWGFASAFTDLDGDGWPDLAVAGDFGASRLFWNRGDGTFLDGTAAAAVGTEENGMGSTIGDVDGDGRPDWFVTSIYDDGPLAGSWGRTGNRLYRNLGGRRFEDVTDALGVRDGAWGWGAVLFDHDNDGDLDLAMTNGIDVPTWSEETEFINDVARFWVNHGGARMEERAAAVGLADRGSGKGVLTFDYDADGDLDLFVVDNSGGPHLYRNDGGNAAGWLRVVVREPSGREALGAVVSVRTTTDGPVQVREIGSSSHFLGQSEAAAHFGLGPGGLPVAEVRVTWPRTRTERLLADVPRNTRLAVDP